MSNERPNMGGAEPRMSLRTRFTLTLLCASVLPLALLAVLTLRIQRSGLEIVEKTLQVTIIEQVRLALDRELDEAAAATRRVGAVLSDGRVPDGETRIALAREAMDEAPLLDHASVYGPEGRLLDAFTRTAAGRGAVLPSVPEVARREGEQPGLWLAPEIGEGGVTLRFVAPVVRGGQLRAWVAGALDRGVVRRRLGEISARTFGRPDQILIVDGALRVLASAAAAPLAEGAELAGRDIFQKVPIDPLSFSQAFGLTTEFPGADGEPMVGTVRSIPARGWAVVVRRAEREAFGALHQTRRIFLGGFLLITALALGIGVWFTARMTRPLAALMDLVRAYGRRDFGRRSSVRTGDELEALGQALGGMADELRVGEAELLRRTRIEGDLSRYLPAPLARSIADGTRSIALGGRRRLVTVLFADVVSFTSFAERAPPEQAAAFLNELFGVLSEVVFRHGGVVDKFLGDCVMALFGAIGDEEDHVARALRSAEDMHRFVESNRPAWIETYGFEVRLGIGINSGEALVGNLGSEVRMEFTAIGDVVNVAARLEAMARPGQTLLPAEAAAATADQFQFHPLGAHPLRGKQKDIEIVELR